MEQKFTQFIPSFSLPETGIPSLWTQHPRHINIPALFGRYQCSQELLQIEVPSASLRKISGSQTLESLKET